MASNDLTLDLVYNYLVENGGKVKNREAVRYFKCYLTDPVLKDDNRLKFKSFINTLAYTRTEGNEKVLFLKTKYQKSLHPPSSPAPSQDFSPKNDPRNSIGIPVSPSYSMGDFSPMPPMPSPPRQPPPYRHPPPVYASSTSLDSAGVNPETPQAPPRRREKSTSSGEATPLRSTSLNEEGTPKSPQSEGEEDKLSVSVKERMQKFNRLASIEDELSPRQLKSSGKSKSRINLGAEEEDGASIVPLEPKKCMEWYVTASKGDLQELLRLATAEPRLVKRKDPFTAYTVLHWGAKYGNPEIIKTFAGKYKVDVNGKTNGGYTPLHISAQFGHKPIFKLLIEVYKADTNIRDYSGRTAEFYLLAKEIQKESPGITLRKIKGRKKQSEKDLGFLRIGSLNVRVKKTTEAFSNYFLGGGQSVNPIEPAEKVLKGWGSADNVNRDNAAQKNYGAKKKSKRTHESGGGSTPTTPKTSRNRQQDGVVESDSDTAAGFDSNWKN